MTSCCTHEASLVGTMAELGWGGWKAKIMTGWGCILPSPHTWRDIQCQAGNLQQPMEITFQLILGRDAGLLGVNLLGLSPRAGK